MVVCNSVKPVMPSYHADSKLRAGKHVCTELHGNFHVRHFAHVH